jgi:hypothetical protein
MKLLLLGIIILSLLWGSKSNIEGGIFSKIKKSVKKTGSAIKSAAKTVDKTAKTAVKIVDKTAKSAVKVVEKTAKTAGSEIATVAKTAGSEIKSGAKLVGSEIATVAKTAGSEIKSGAKLVGSEIKSAAKTAGSEIAKVAKKAGSVIKKLAKKDKKKKRTISDKKYNGIIIIQSQLKILAKIKDRVSKIPLYEIEPKTRREINDNLDIIIKSLRTWLNNTINIKSTTDKSIDELNKMWINNGIGLKILADATIERLNIGEESQEIIIELLRRFIDNMNIDLGIVIPNTEKDDDENKNKNDENENKIIDGTNNNSIFGKIIGFLPTTNEKDYTYEERYPPKL